MDNDVEQEQYEAYIKEGKTVRQAIADAIAAEREACIRECTLAIERVKSLPLNDVGIAVIGTVTQKEVGEVVRSASIETLSAIKRNLTRRNA